MMMRKSSIQRILGSLLAILAGGVCGCATQSQSLTQHLVLSMDENSDGIWAETAENLTRHHSQYEISVSRNGDEKRVFNRIWQENGQSGICLAPRTIWREESEQEPVFIPAYCRELDASRPEESLKTVLDNTANHQIVMAENETPVHFRQRVLAMSTPEDPVCFGVFPDLFSIALGDPSVHLIESYLIACANKIDDETKNHGVSHQMANWLRIFTALLSTNSQFISNAFELAKSDETYEGIGPGKALEAHIELLSHKLLQAEYTTRDAIQISDAQNQYFVSRQNIERIHYMIETAEVMHAERIKALILALEPIKSAPKMLNQLRYTLQILVCRQAVIIPEITPSFVAACLPWLEMSIEDSEEYDSALMLVTHGIDGTPDGESAIDPKVLSWLQNTPSSDELIAIRKSFAQRMINHAKINPSERQILESF